MDVVHDKGMLVVAKCMHIIVHGVNGGDFDVVMVKIHCVKTCGLV